MARKRILGGGTRRAEQQTSIFSRRLLSGLVFLGLVVVLDLILFGWLIFNSLSRREVERVLLQTRVEAKDLAEQIANEAGRQGGDLFLAVSSKQEIRRSIGSVLSELELVRDIKVYDDSNRLVFQENSRRFLPGEATPDEVEGLRLEGAAERESQVTVEENYVVEEPIADFGVVRIGLSQEELRARTELLRRDLLRQAVLLGAITLGILAAAGAAIFLLLRRGRELEGQTIQQEHLAHVGTLASGLAHEIRSPLNSLSLNMQMLEEEVHEGGGSSERLLGITRSEIARLEGLVSDFLSYARPRPLDLELVSAVGLLEHTQQLVAVEARARRIDFEVVDKSEGAQVEVDRGQIGQLLLNLVNNAMAAVAEAQRPPRIRLIAEKRSQRVDLIVADNGIGIPAEKLDKVFDAFFSERRGGTGLGLPIVRRIAENHGGGVEIDSAVGTGATVRVSLPLPARRTSNSA